MHGVAIPEAPRQSGTPGPLYYALMESLRDAEYKSRSAQRHPEYKRRRIESRSAAQGNEHERRKHLDYTSKSPHRIRLNIRNYESDGSLASDSDSDDFEHEDTDSEQDNFSSEDRVPGEGEGEEDGPIVIPSQSPLKRSFGIFCTGKGKGIQNSSNLKHFQQNQTRLRITT